MKKVAVKEKGSTLFLRVAIIGLALIVLGLCALILPEIYGDWGPMTQDIRTTRFPILFSLVIAAAAFWLALYQGWKLLGNIDKNRVFSESSVRAINTMKLCSFLISGLFAAMYPVIFFLVTIDGDTPGMIIIYGVIFVGAPLVFAIALGVLQRLLNNAINIKSENDLTV